MTQTKITRPGVTIEGLRVALNVFFEFLAVELPRLSVEILSVVDVIRPSAEGQALDDSSELVTATDAIEHELRHVDRDLVLAQQQIRTVLVDLEPVVVQLAEAIDHTRTGSRRLRLLALNASLVSLTGGAGIRGFAAATGELIEIAAHQLRDADRVMGSIEGVRERFARLQMSGDDFEQCVGHTNLGVVEDALGKILRSFRDLQQELAGVTAQFLEFQGWISRAMVAIQRQDILRQGLDHVSLIEQERARASRTMAGQGSGGGCSSSGFEALSVEREASRLCIELLDSIGQETDDLLAEVGAVLRSLENIARSVADPVRSQWGAELPQRFTVLRSAVNTLRLNLQAASTVCIGRKVIVAELEQLMRPLPAHLRNFADRHQQVRLLGITVQRQSARLANSAGTQPIAEILGEISRDTDVDWQDLVDVACRALAILRPIAANRAAAQVCGSSQLGIQLTELEEAAELVAKRLALTVSTVHSASTRLSQAAQRMQERLASIEREMTERTALVEFYRLRVARADQTLEEPPFEGSEWSGASERIKELAARFTIVAHKHLVAGHAPSEVQPNDGPGSLTLF